MTKQILSSILIMAAMTGCANVSGPTQTAAFQPTTVGAQAAKKVMSDKAEATTKQTSTSKLGAKASSTTAKKADAFKVSVPDVRNLKQINDQDIRSIASMTLVSMDRAKTYDSACRIGYDALERLNDDTNQANMVVRFGLYGAKSQEEWKNAYKVQSLALNYLAQGQPSTGRSVYRLAQDMMGATTTYVDGSKVGYELLETIEKVDRNSSVRRIASYAYGSAKQATRWEDAYNTISQAFREMGNQY